MVHLISISADTQFDDLCERLDFFHFRSVQAQPSAFNPKLGHSCWVSIWILFALAFYLKCYISKATCYCLVKKIYIYYYVTQQQHKRTQHLQGCIIDQWTAPSTKDLSIPMCCIIFFGLAQCHCITRCTMIILYINDGQINHLQYMMSLDDERWLFFRVKHFNKSFKRFVCLLYFIWN